MKRLILLLALAAPGCAVERFNAPPGWASVVTTHERFFGLNASVPVGSGTLLGVKLGWGSVTWTVLPCATNCVFVPKISDTFSVGQELNPFNTSIKEYLQTGWEGATPAPALKLLQP